MRILFHIYISFFINANITFLHMHQHHYTFTHHSIFPRGCHLYVQTPLTLSLTHSLIRLEVTCQNFLGERLWEGERAKRFHPKHLLGTSECERAYVYTFLCACVCVWVRACFRLHHRSFSSHNLSFPIGCRGVRVGSL